MNTFKAALLFFFSFLSGLIQAQEYTFDVQHINVEEGLPDRRVLNVLQDKKGFIWVSTPGAISRYDGYQFKTYNADFLKIRENTGVKFAIDQQNNLWYQEEIDNKSIVGIVDTETDAILSIEDYTNGLFTAQDITAFSADRVNKAVFYIGTKDGNIYKYEEGFTIKYFALINSVNFRKWIFSIDFL